MDTHLCYHHKHTDTKHIKCSSWDPSLSSSWSCWRQAQSCGLFLSWVSDQASLSGGCRGLQCASCTSQDVGRAEHEPSLRMPEMAHIQGWSSLLKFRLLVDFHGRNYTFRKEIWRTSISACLSILPTAGCLSKAGLLHMCLCLIGLTKQFLLLCWQSLWACWAAWLSPALWLCLFRLCWTPSMGSQARTLLPPAPLLPWNKLMFVYWMSLILSYCFFPVHSPLLPHTKQNQNADVLKCSHLPVQLCFCFRKEKEVHCNESRI